MNHSTHNVFVGLQGNPIKQQNKNIQWLTHSVQQTLVFESHTNESENSEPHLKEKLCKVLWREKQCVVVNMTEKRVPESKSP